MPLSEQEIQELVQNPSEHLSVELKDWFDPNSVDGQAKLIKGCFALRNHNGGAMLIGFCDENGTASIRNHPENARETFHIDTIQAIIMRHASEGFEISIDYPIINNIEVVVIQVPSGVKTPVITKRALDTLISINQIYIRTLNANHTPSSSLICYKDWPDLLEKCFDNREANIGRFIRRHLTSENINNFLAGIGENKCPETFDERLTEYLDESKARYDELVSERALTLPKHGSLEIAVLFDNQCSRYKTSAQFLGYIWQTNPRHNGWPVWLDTSNFRDNSTHPYVYQDHWEALIVLPENGIPDHIDFWRINPEGKFYLYRALQDDINHSVRRPDAGTMLDFKLAIDRVAESISVVSTFAKGMECGEQTNLHFIFRWSGLKGRELGCWVDPERDFSIMRIAQQDVFVKSIQVPIDVAKPAIAGYVYEVIIGLFLLFDGFTIANSEVERIVNDTLSKHF